MPPGLFFSASAQGHSEFPNIVIILADDLGYGDVKALNPEAKVSTPHIDALARTGLTFTDAHSPSSVCTPTRYGLLTGRYAWRTSLKEGVLWPYDPPLIASERLTLPEMLREAGYRTAAIGKWHLGWDWKLVNGGYARDSLEGYGYDRAARARVEKWVDFSQPLENGPTIHGFDQYFGDDVPNFPPYAFIENDRLQGIPDRPKPDSLYGNPGMMREGWDLEAVMPTLTEKAVTYISDRSNEPGGEPFFLYLALTAPHTPIAPADRFKGSSRAGRYGDYVQQVDATVGRVMQALSEAGMAERTLVIFTSDNGSPGRDGENMGGQINAVQRFGHFPSYHFRGIKSDIWEGGHRVPLIMRWPNAIRSAGVTDQLACLTDIMATCASILDIRIPPDAAEDSYDLLPVLREPEGIKPVREAIVHHSIDGSFAIRKGSWKLILSPGSGGWSPPGNEAAIQMSLPGKQLYRLEDDIGERKNRIADYPDKAAELSRLLEEYRARGRSAPWPGLRVAPQAVAAEVTEVDGFPVLKGPSVLQQDGRFIWGGSVIRGADNRFHMFFSTWDCGPDSLAFTDSWVLRSEIGYATSDLPDRDFKIEKVFLRGRRHEGDELAWDAQMVHNPHIKRFEGKYYLYYIGSKDPGPPSKGEPGAELSKRDRVQQNQKIGVVVFEDFEDILKGTYQRSEHPILTPRTRVKPDRVIHPSPPGTEIKPDNLIVTNPSVVFRASDGKYLLYFKGNIYDPGWRGVHGVALADAPTGPFTARDEIMFDVRMPEGNTASTEDPYVWYHPGRRQFYAVVKDFSGRISGREKGLALLRSEDGEAWEPAESPNFMERAIPMPGGKLLKADRLERPQLLIDENGNPRVFYGACALENVNPRVNGGSFNVQIPLVGAN